MAYIPNYIIAWVSYLTATLMQTYYSVLIVILIAHKYHLMGDRFQRNPEGKCTLISV